jgi:2-iminobutanoate/2-iminopropanoate deaminase
MDKKVISSPKAPAPIGRYSQGIEIPSSGLIFCCGQIGLDPATGSMVSGGVEAEARRALENLRAVLEAAGSSMEHVVKTTVFLPDLADFPKVNDVYSGFFGPDAPPARTTIGVAALPKGGRVEIEAIAVRR